VEKFAGREDAMKLALSVTLTIVGLTALANAAPDVRRSVRLECRQAARAMHYLPNTAKWKNSIKKCMIDRGFNGR
jgi:hypothetical protein